MYIYIYIYFFIHSVPMGEMKTYTFGSVWKKPIIWPQNWTTNFVSKDHFADRYSSKFMDTSFPFVNLHVVVSEYQVYIYIYTLDMPHSTSRFPFPRIRMQYVYIYIYVCVSIYIYMYIYIYICRYIYIYIINICKDIYMNNHIYI